MVTNFQITYPQHPGQAFPIAASNGQTLPSRARSDVRPKKGYPVRILTRAEWDDQNKVAGPYLAAYQPKRPVPDVDFEAEDGSLHSTAEACLAHELQARFGVSTLAEVEAQMKATVDKFTVGDANADLYDLNGNPPFSGVPDKPLMNSDDSVRLLASALSQRALKVTDAAKATGLTPAQVRATAAGLPEYFEHRGGRVFLVG